MPDASRSIWARLTRFLAGMYAGEANYLSGHWQRDELDALMARFQELTDDDTLRLAHLWQHEDADARRHAWTKAQAAVNESAGEELERIRQAVAGWTNARQSDFQGAGGLLGSAGASASARQAAAPAVIDKAVALLARDSLDDRDHLVLARPWDTLVASEIATGGDDRPSSR